MNQKAYSSVVERTAHNGFVVGSSPARLIRSNSKYETFN